VGNVGKPHSVYYSKPTATTMASVLLRRQLSRTAPRIIRRHLSSTSSLQAGPSVQQSVPSEGAKNVFDTHTVEDLHGMSAAEILAETGTRADAKMRHFTGTEVVYIQADTR
jgi:NADH dehydrogenase (ubiquinone) Fe-S protein 2